MLCAICRHTLVICFHKGRLFFTVNDSRKSHRNIGRWKSNTLKFLNVLRDQPTKQLIQSHSKPSKQTRQPTEQVTNIQSWRMTTEATTAGVNDTTSNCPAPTIASPRCSLSKRTRTVPSSRVSKTVAGCWSRSGRSLTPRTWTHEPRATYAPKTRGKSKGSSTIHVRAVKFLKGWNGRIM